jgi:hypothetical protein
MRDTRYDLDLTGEILSVHQDGQASLWCAEKLNTYCAPFIKTRSDGESKVHGMGDGPRTMLFDATVWKRVVKA